LHELGEQLEDARDQRQALDGELKQLEKFESGTEQVHRVLCQEYGCGTDRISMRDQESKGSREGRLGSFRGSSKE